MKKTNVTKSPYANVALDPIKAPHKAPQPKSTVKDAGTGDLRVKGGKKQ